MKITNECNMKLMSRYEDNYFDLAIVDPPYSISNFIPTNHYKNSKAKYKYKWNNKKPSKLYFKELKRVTKERIIFGANYYNCFEKKGGAIIWYKDQKHPNMSQCEIASYSKYQKVDYYRYDWTNTDKYNELRKTDIHPCQKPVSLYEWLLINYAKKGDKILDTHLGSGSLAIACHNLKYDLTACELDREYYNLAIKRIEQHKLQTRIF